MDDLNERDLEKALMQTLVTGTYTLAKNYVLDYSFKKLHFQNLKIINGSFTCSYFENCKFTNVIFEEVNLEECDFVGCDFENTTFKGCETRNIQFVKCKHMPSIV